MILDSMALDNFRQYYGRQRLQFARRNKQNVTVIHGINGAGKTSLFLALNWCLYDEGVDNIGELISKEAISRGKSRGTSPNLCRIDLYSQWRAVSGSSCLARP